MSKSKDNEKKSFVMYASFLEAMKHLNDAEFRECMIMIGEYGLNGVEMQSSSPMVNVIMELVKPNLAAAGRRYDACVENGKKGAEYGKLGGAPKGNQNARKKQPLKQPLDVDVEENVYVKVDENEEVIKNSYDNENTPLGSMSSQSSFSNSSEASIIDATTLEDADLEGDLSHSKSRIGMTMSSGKSETPLYSKSNSDHNTGSTCIAKAGSSAARRQQNKYEGVDMGEYMERVIANSIGRLAAMKQQGKELDKGLLNSTIDNIIAQYSHHDRKSAYKIIMQGMEAMIANNLL
ncbi:MAG: hypothetical protein IKJ08_05105 [Alistipes sp.]|nr:hypothetical protein [Alistipes sp.]